MACLEDLKQRLAILGLTPLPHYYESFLEAICEGTTPDIIADFLHRLNSWPRILLDISRRYDISDTDYEELKKNFLKCGDDVFFQQMVENLPARKEALQGISLPPFELHAAREKVGRSQRRAEFESILAEQQSRAGAAGVRNQQEIDDLRRKFITGAMTAKDLRDALSGSSPPNP